VAHDPSALSFIIDIIREIRWRPTIGDPTAMGWFTVIAYGLAAVMALGVYLRKKDRIWIGVALGMAALCINKELDLQSLFTDIGRVASSHLGVYEQRREFQKWFVLGVVAGAGVLGTWFVFRHHAFWLHHKLLSSGLFFLMTFIVVRAISFHHFDAFLKSRFLGVKMNWTLELGGILLVGLAAAMELARPAKPK
jgi:hypothetical protein